MTLQGHPRSLILAPIDNSNLCDYNPPTSQTDGQTDDMRSQDRACIIVHRAVIIISIITIVNIPAVNNVRDVFNIVLVKIQRCFKHLCRISRITAKTPLQRIGELRDMIPPQSNEHRSVLGADDRPWIQLGDTIISEINGR